MDYYYLNLLIQILLVSDISAVKFERFFCPLGSKVIKDEVGCDICVCCLSSTNSDFIINCQNLDLKSIPELSRSVTDLDMSENKITSIGNDSFSGLSNLTQLNLYTNPLTNMSTGCMKPLTNLQFLKLPTGNINDASFLQFMPALTHLGFWCDYVPINVTLQKVWFGYMKSLTILDIYPGCLTLDYRYFPHHIAAINIDNIGTRYINMPDTTVNILNDDRAFMTFMTCFQFETLYVKTLKFPCKGLSSVGIDKYTFSSLQNVSDQLHVDIKAKSLTSYVPPLKLENIYNLSIQIDYMNETEIVNLTNRLRHTTINTLSINIINGVTSTTIIRNLLTTEVKELTIKGVFIHPIPYEDFELLQLYNLTSLVLDNCKIDTADIIDNLNKRVHN